MRYDLTAGIHQIDGASNFHLELFGNDLAKREGYRVHEGMEALRFFLICTYGYLPRDVNSMSMQDIRFLFAEEMHGWTCPSEARKAYPMPSLPMDAK